MNVQILSHLASTPLPRYREEEIVEGTRNPFKRARVWVSSSVTPSQQYRWLPAELRSVNGRTASYRYFYSEAVGPTGSVPEVRTEFTGDVVMNSIFDVVLRTELEYECCDNPILIVATVTGGLSGRLGVSDVAVTPRVYARTRQPRF